VNATGCALFQRYRGLSSSLPRLRLGTSPSPVRRLAGLERRIGPGEIWVKNDGSYGTVYGGNKTRKLEFILADVLRRGASTIITFGGMGSHHCLATALYAPLFGLKTVLVLVDQPTTDEVRTNIERLRASGARLHHAHSPVRAALLGGWLALRHASLSRPRLPYVLWPGGSTAVGCLGYVNAALELGQQVEAAELPRPASIVVPLGSNGTAAGLLLGLRLAGLDSRLIAVRVSHYPGVGAAGVARLANAAARLLRSRGAGIPQTPFVPADLRVVESYLGRGYSYPTAEAEAAKDLVLQAEGLQLDLTYTAKAFAAVLALLQTGLLPKGPVLYWHTLNALPLPAAPVGQNRT